MKQATKRNNIIMLTGGMVLSAGLLMLAAFNSQQAWAAVAQKTVSILFFIGAIAYTAAQRQMAYASTDFTLNRLFSLQFLSGFCFVIAGLDMTEQYWTILKPLVVKDIDSYFIYIRVVYNNWVVLLLIGGLLQLYTSHRIANIESKMQA